MEEELFKLSGMKYASHYTAKEWEEKTGVNPQQFYPSYIGLSNHNKCYWKPEAEHLYQNWKRGHHKNLNTLGA